MLSVEVMFILLNKTDDALVNFLQKITFLPVKINCLNGNKRLTRQFLQKIEHLTFAVRNAVLLIK